jgi:hypothetical protein
MPGSEEEPSLGEDPSDLDSCPSQDQADTADRTYTPVNSGQPLPTPPQHGPFADEPGARQRHQELTDLDHLIEVAKRIRTIVEVMEETAERKRRGWTKRAYLKLSVWFLCAAGGLAIGRGVWLFIHPPDHFELVAWTISYCVSGVCACVGGYVLGRSGRTDKSASDPPPFGDVLRRLSGEP